MAIYRGVGGSGESTTNTIVNLVAQYTFDAEAAKIAAQASQTAAEAAKVVAVDASSDASISAVSAAQSAVEAEELVASISEFDPDNFATAAQGDNADTAFGWGDHADAGYAADSTVVKLTGNQTIAGTKTFSSTIAGSINGNAATATNVAYSGLTGTVPTWNQNTTGNAATVTNGVYTTGDQTIAGVKTFSNDPVMGVSALTGDIAAARITGALNASGSAPIYAARAWVNFNGTGTVAIRSSGNVSSIVDNGVGDYTVNFTTAMPDANYAGLGTLADTNLGALLVEVRENQSRTKTTGAFPINTAAGGNGSNRALFDFPLIYVAIFR